MKVGILCNGNKNVANYIMGVHELIVMDTYSIEGYLQLKDVVNQVTFGSLWKKMGKIIKRLGKVG
jgi:hypothetical protein